MLQVAKVPSPDEADHGVVLEAAQLRALLQGFKGSPLFLIVAVAAFTGARRNEILALRWDDLEVAGKTLRIERAIEETRAGLRLKGPKTERGKRTIIVDDGLIALLTEERDRHRRLAAGIPDGARVDLSLVELPQGAPMFPSPNGGLRDPHAVTRTFVRRARKLGFRLRFHDLRGTHETHYSMLGCRCMSLRPAVAMIPLCCFGATLSERGRPTLAQPRPLAR